MSSQWQSVSCNYSNSKELEKVFKKLVKLVPHIHWRIGWHDHDLGPYSTLEVPLTQNNEAEYIIERYENGESFTNYSYKDKYPITFTNNNGVRVINSSILAFYDLANEFIQTVSNFDSLELASFINRMLILLPKLYIAGRELQCDCGGNDIYHEDTEYKELNFGKYDKFFDVKNTLNNFATVEEYSISEVIEKIMEEIQSRVEEFIESDPDPDVLAGIVHHWQYSFKSTFGIGNDIVRLIKVFHNIIVEFRI